jgi:hypothetical protein
MGAFLAMIFERMIIPIAIVIAISAVYFGLQRTDLSIEPVISVMVLLSPLWLPYLLFYIMFEEWREYIRMKWRIDNGRVTLRIKLPQEVFKSPEAMEAVFNQIYDPSGADNLYQTYIDGKNPLAVSCELVSHGGEVRFYVNVPKKKFKNRVEAQLYAHYPGIEVVEELIDYAAEVQWSPDKYEMMAFHINKKDNQIFPIKTYIDFGLDKLPKEEEKFEPMATMIEQIGRLKPHERIWIQFLAKAHAKKNFGTGDLHESGTWEKDIAAHVGKLLGRDKDKKGPLETEMTPRLTRSEQDTVTAMERNGSKYAYEVAIRMLYITEKGKFNGESLLALRTFAQYDMIGRNRVGVVWRSDFDYNWFSDFSGAKKLSWKKSELHDYKLREYSARAKSSGGSKSDDPKVFSSEELATMFHIPGSAVISPSLPRIMSTRKEAPSNLPTGLSSTI